MANHKGKETVTLEALLRLKRLEQPGSDFWDSFDNDFQQRRLQALVEKDTLRSSLWNTGLVRAVAIGVPALLLAGMSVFWSGLRGPAGVPDQTLAAGAVAAEAAIAATHTGDAGDRAPAGLLAGSASNQFVVDAFEASAEASLPFRRVLYTPAIRLSPPSGSSYVKDSLSAGSYQVTTADLRLGRNF